MAGNGRNPGESVADKLFAVLDAFDGERPELTAAQLSRITGVPPSTLSRLLRCLVKWGGLTRTADGSYQVGAKLWQISTRCHAANDVRRAALPVMRDLSLMSRGQVGLCVVEGDEAVIVEHLSNPLVGRVLGSAGGRIPLHASALGKVLLAFTPEPFVSNALSRPLDRFTTKTLLTPYALRREISHVRAQRYAVCGEELVVGQLGVAVPVFGLEQGRVAALGIAVEDGVASVRELAAALQEAAHHVSERWQRMPLESPRSITPETVRSSSSKAHPNFVRTERSFVGTASD